MTKSKETFLDKINPLKQCKEYHIPLWQCPSFLFLVMGVVIIGVILATYVIAALKIDDPATVVLIVIAVAVVLLIIDYIIALTLPIMSKKTLLVAFVLFVVISLAVSLLFWLLFLNPRTSILIDKDSGCYQRCTQAGFNRGICMAGGSGIGSGCAQAGGTLYWNIDNPIDNPIPGCSFRSIGQWDECCCF